MRIGFDAKRFFHNFTGLGNYSRFVVDALARNQSNAKLFLFTPSSRTHPEIDSTLALENVKVVTPTFPWKLAGRSVWRTGLSSFEKPIKNLDVFHGLSHELPLFLPSDVKKVVTVHDLIFLRFPNLYNPIDVRIYKRKVISACSRADKIIAISEQTATDIVDFLKVDRSKIEVVYQGCHPQFQRKTSEDDILKVKQKYSLPSQFILNVGTIEKRKNIELVVKAMALMPSGKRIPLVIVGRATPYLQEVKRIANELGVTSLVHFIHDASFADFPAIYSAALLFVYPSIFEGFGIPLIESIESGVPVVTSTGSCFSEAAGPTSTYVDPYNESMMADVLLELLSSPTQRDQSLAGAKEWITKFTPEKISVDLMNVYRSL